MSMFREQGTSPAASDANPLMNFNASGAFNPPRDLCAPRKEQGAAVRNRAPFMWAEASDDASPDATDATGDGEGLAGDEGGLEDAARGEREYVRERLRGELNREPTEEELNEWLREHTEGY